MAIVTSTKRYLFRSVHALNSGPRTEIRHGHEYFLEVTCLGVDTALVESAVRSRVIDRLDKHDLTGLIEPATGEVIVDWAHEQLGDLAIAVALQETRKNRFISARSDRRYVG